MYEYPLWFLIDEVAVARQRINNHLQTTAVLTSAGYGATQSKPGAGLFKKLLEKFW